MKKIIFILLYCVLNILNISAQTTESLVEKNKLIACNCLKEIDQIDTLEDLEVKFQNCLKPNKTDSLQLQKNGHLEAYQEKLEITLLDSCPNIETKSQTLIENYYSNLANYNYDLEKPYKEVEKKVIGGYSLAFGHHSPEGSPKLFIYPENRYAIVSFGEVQVGTWRVVKEKLLHLIPNKTKYPFRIYGRHNPKIKDATKTSFIGDDFSYNTLIHYGELTEKPLLTPIFNIDANCFDFPYKKTIDKVYDKVSLAHNRNYENQGDEEVIIHSFENTQKFNDFIIYENTRMDDRPTIIATIGDDSLTFEKDRVTSKSSLDNISDEDNLFLTKIMKVKEIAPFVYYNPGYRRFDERSILSKMYSYDKKLNTFVSEEECRNDCLVDDYHNRTYVNKYELLENITTHKKQFTISEKSAIYTVCD